MNRGRVPGSSNRVNRGGSFNNAAVNARSANRNNDTPENADNNLGLRPAKTSPTPDRRGRREATPTPRTAMSRPASRA